MQQNCLRGVCCLVVFNFQYSLLSLPLIFISPFPLSLYVPFSLSPSLSPPSLYLSLLPLSLFLSLSISPSLPLFLSLFLSISPSLTFSFSPSLSLPLLSVFSRSLSLSRKANLDQVDWKENHYFQYET